jgi:ABC-type glycerol-3-phosphate transport system permease component
MAGALGVTCTECGADVLEARVRLGPQRSAVIVIAPLAVGTLSWMFFVWVVAQPGTFSSRSFVDSVVNVLLLVTLATQVLSLIASIVFAWRFSRASCRTQDRWIVAAWLALFMPLVLWPLPFILYFL